MVSYVEAMCIYYCSLYRAIRTTCIVPSPTYRAQEDCARQLWWPPINTIASMWYNSSSFISSNNIYRITYIIRQIQYCVLHNSENTISIYINQICVGKGVNRSVGLIRISMVHHFNRHRYCTVMTSLRAGHRYTPTHLPVFRSLRTNESH